jgi:hypothetical protein
MDADAGHADAPRSARKRDHTLSRHDRPRQPRTPTTPPPRTHKLKALRKRLGLSLEEGAAKLGLCRSALRRAEMGLSPNLDTTARLVIASGGKLRFEDFLDPRELQRIRRHYRNALAGPKRRRS